MSVTGSFDSPISRWRLVFVDMRADFSAFLKLVDARHHHDLARGQTGNDLASSPSDVPSVT